MTELPDTAEIRERWAAWSPAPMAPGGTILALCDALDAARDFEKASERWAALYARAEAAEAEAEWNKNQALLQEERSEAAEALAAQLQEVADHCHVLEARIAAALNALHGPATDAVRVAAAIDALTEGTGQ